MVRRYIRRSVSHAKIVDFTRESAGFSLAKHLLQGNRQVPQRARHQQVRRQIVLVDHVAHAVDALFLGSFQSALGQSITTAHQEVDASRKLRQRTLTALLHVIPYTRERVDDLCVRIDQLRAGHVAAQRGHHRRRLRTANVAQLARLGHQCTDHTAQIRTLLQRRTVGRHIVGQGRVAL